MACVRRRYWLAAFLFLALVPGRPASAAETYRDSEITVPETADIPEEDDILKQEEWGAEDWEIEASAGELMETLKNSETIYSPQLEKSYHSESGMFTYMLPNESSFSASVPDGMMTNGPVTFLPMDNAYIVVTRNGMMAETAPDGVYILPGDYKFKILVFPGDLLSGNLNYYQVRFEFQILADVDSALNFYSAPEGFYITSITCDNEEIKPENPKWEFLRRDGAYTIQMLDEETESIFCEVSFIRDTTAPFLLFTPEVEQETMNEPVMITVSEPRSNLQAFYNGTEGVLASNIISREGVYEFYVSDAAGNKRYYRLKMEGRSEGPRLKTVILTIIGAAVLSGFLIYQRRHMRFL